MAVGVVALRAFVDALALFLWRRLAFLSFFRTPVSNVRMNEITINVRFSADLVVPLRLAREVTVKNLKERLAEHLSLPVEEIRVIFAGKELFDQVSIKVNDEFLLTVRAETLLCVRFSQWSFPRHAFVVGVVVRSSDLSRR